MNVASLCCRTIVSLACLFSGSLLYAQMPKEEQFRAVFQEHVVRVGSTPIHYVMGGHGSPVLLLHGFPETWYAWRNVMPALVQEHTVLAVDLPGIGVGEPPRTPPDTAAISDLIHQLVVQLGYHRIDLAAHDFGVAVAYAYASRHRDEVLHLALLDVPPQGTESFERLRTTAWAFGFQKLPELPEQLVLGHERAYMTEGFFKPLAANPGALSSEDLDVYVRAYSVTGVMHSAFEWYRAFDTDIAQNRSQLQTLLPMPVLMMGGDHSGGPLMADTAKELAHDGASFIIPNCGHWLLDEQPVIIGSKLRDFFAAKY